MKLTDEQLARIEAKYCPEALTGCWLWFGATGNGGYGTVRWGAHETRKVKRVHRLMYEHHKGTVPEGLELDHLCRNPACINPDHLEAVTHRENMLRQWKYRDQAHCKNGHDLAKVGVYTTRAGGKWCKVCKLERAKAFYAKNANKINEKKKVNYKEHHGSI